MKAVTLEDALKQTIRIAHEMGRDHPEYTSAQVQAVALASVTKVLGIQPDALQSLVGVFVLPQQGKR